MRWLLQRWGMIGLLILVVFGVGCARHAPAPIEEKIATQAPPKTGARTPKSLPARTPIKGEIYRVQAGDTLYSIAWRLGLDFRQLATMNGIKDPSHIVVGQALRVRAARAQSATRNMPGPKRNLADTRVVPPVASTAARSTAPRTPSTPKNLVRAPPTNLRWVWPAEGRASRAVSATGSLGLEIRGTRGQTIHAAGGGQVVYGGSGLRGYGQLLIIKHDESFLSAYAHNDKLLVNEGQRVVSGQPIALMGDSGASEVMLHFEIRKGGKAVEPLQYLPKR
jgi:lipoprotein NlpD